MKKKIALLLAAVMMFAAAVPMSLFASTTYSISDYYTNLGAGSVVTNNSDLANSAIVAADAVGSNLTFTYTSDANSAGGTFDLTLENAMWLYFTDLANQYSRYAGSNPSWLAYLTAEANSTVGAGYGQVFVDADRYVYFTNVMSYVDDEGGTIAVNTVDILRGAAAVAIAGGNAFTLGTKYSAVNVPYYAVFSIDDVTLLSCTVLNKPISGNKITVPLIFRTTADANVTLKCTVKSVVSVGINAFPAQTIVEKTGTGDFVAMSIVEGRDKFNLDDIRITESKPNVASDGGAFIIEAPEGYAFLQPTASYPVTVRNGAGSSRFSDLVLESAYVPVSGQVKYYGGKLMNFSSGKYMVVSVKLGDLPNPLTKVNRYFYLQGIRLTVIDDNYAEFDEIVPLTFYDMADLEFTFSGTNSLWGGAAPVHATHATYLVEEEDPIEVDVLKRVEYGLQFETTSTTINEIYAGIPDVSNNIVFNERAMNSLLGHGDDTRFELVDEEGNSLSGLVKIRNAFVVSVSNFKSVVKNTAGVNTHTGFNNVDINVYDNYITLLGNGIATDARGLLTFRLGLTARADFTGDVYLKATGRSIPRGEAEEPIHVATVVAPVEVNTTTSEVEVGYQAIKVSKIVITEAEAGLFELGGKINLEMDTYGYTNYIPFSNLTAITVNYTGDGILERISANSGILTLTVTRASKNTPFAITIDGIHVDVNRSVPEGKYDLVVSGDAFVFNYNATAPVANVDKTFQTKGLVVPAYVKVVTPGSNQALSKNVAVSLENPSVAIVDGTTNYDISAAPAYIDPVTNRTMFSIKYIAMALGIAESEVKWDGVARTVTIYTNSRSTVTMFYIDKDFYTINNGVQNMVDDNGVHAYSVISNERSYIPMKYLAEAFGLTAIWNPTTRTAYFNPTEAQKVDCALANAGE